MAKTTGIRSMVQIEKYTGTERHTLNDRKPSLSTVSNSGESAAPGKWAAWSKCTDQL